MLDAWIYSDDPEHAAWVAAQLAELGFSPRHVRANGSLRPSDSDGSAARAPELALVVGEQETCVRLRNDIAFADIPIILSMRPEELDGRVPPSDELLVPPFTSAELEA